LPLRSPPKKVGYDLQNTKYYKESETRLRLRYGGRRVVTKE